MERSYPHQQVRRAVFHFLEIIFDLADLLDFLRNLSPLSHYPGEPWYWRWSGIVLLVLTLGGLMGASFSDSRVYLYAALVGGIALLLDLGLRSFIQEKKRS